MPNIIWIIISFVFISYIVAAIFFWKFTKKDFLKTLLVLSKIYSAILIPLLLGYISYYVQSLSRSAEFQKHDVAIMTAFQDTYFCQDKRGLSVHYLSLLNDKKMQIELRIFVAWNVFNRNVRKPNFVFNKDDDEWHIFGENIREMYDQNPEIAPGFYHDFKERAPKIILGPEKQHLCDPLFAWVDKTYGFK